MNALKPIAGFVLLLLGALILLSLFAQVFAFCVNEPGLENQSAGYKIGFHFGRFAALGFFATLAFLMIRTGWRWLVFRSKLDPVLGRNDVLDDGDLHQKSNNQL